MSVKLMTRMARPNDARALRSRVALQEALLSLVGEKPFEQVSIKEITTRAGVSYPVFFRRYENKEQLLNDIAETEVQRLLALTLPVFDADEGNASIQILCRYIADHRTLWTQLLTGGAGSAMREEFKRIARETGNTRSQVNPWLPRDLAPSFVVSGLFEILAWWLAQPSDYPIDRVVTLIDVLIVQSTGRARDIRF